MPLTITGANDSINIASISERNDMSHHANHQGGMTMPLTFAKAGDTMTISKIKGRDDTRRHLNNLGFIVGDQVMIVSEQQGNLIVRVKDTRIAINKKMASRIMVD